MAAIQNLEKQNETHRPDPSEVSRIKKMAASIGAGALLLSVSGSIIKDHINNSPKRNISYLVQPGDTVNGIVQKLEHKYGQDPVGYDYQGEEFELAQEHPVLQPGQLLSVPVQ